MALLEKELDICIVKEIFSLNLQIPNYQRPYRWSTTSANTLFNDILEACQSEKQRYRLGTVILHKDGEKYNVVDGQQRLTTLSILLYCLGEGKSSCKYLLDAKYSELSYKAIKENCTTLKKRVDELELDAEKFKEYILNNCEIVKIVTGCKNQENEEEKLEALQEAFQFFDSQNNRGKALNPHDLLKAYHLREMKKEQKAPIKIINQWENYNQNELSEIFSTYLYPILNWYKKRSGLNFSEKEIKIFKGFSNNSEYNFAKYHKNIQKIKKNKDYKFQLTEPIISGEYFFLYIFHYKKLLEKIREKIKEFEQKIIKENKEDKETIIPENRIGERYTKELFECVLLFFADRFNIKELDNRATMKQLYTWSYSIRLAMESLGKQTINNYSCGKISQYAKFNNTENGIAMFEKISEMLNPRELEEINFPELDLDTSNLKHIHKLLIKWNNWKDVYND